MLVNGIIGFGGVYTGCNPSYTAYELIHHLKSSQTQVVVVEPELLQTCLKATGEAGLPRNRILIFDDNNIKVDDDMELKSWRTLFDHGELNWPKFDDLSTASNTTAALLYSSGTTGKRDQRKLDQEVDE